MFVFYERGDPAPTLTFSTYLAFGTIGLTYFCQGRGNVETQYFASLPANDEPGLTIF